MGACSILSLANGLLCSYIHLMDRNLCLHEVEVEVEVEEVSQPGEKSAESALNMLLHGPPH